MIVGLCWDEWQHQRLPLQHAASAQMSTLQDALAAGADIAVQSTHKTLSSLTQSSMLHMKGGRVSQQRLQLALNLLQASSQHSGGALGMHANRCFWRPCSSTSLNLLSKWATCMGSSPAWAAHPSLDGSAGVLNHQSPLLVMLPAWRGAACDSPKSIVCTVEVLQPQPRVFDFSACCT